MKEKFQTGWRGPVIFILMIIMMAALFISRAFLSAGIIAFTTFSLIHPGFKKQVQYFISSPLLWGMSLLFLLPLISGLWSRDQETWLDIISIKSPLFFLPLAFAGPLPLSKKQWEVLGFIFIAFVTAATAWSMFHYAGNIHTVNESYLRAKSIITPLENDHIRFSWLVSVAVLLSACLWMAKRREKKYTGWILVVLVAWLVIYLHLLAARTGLISFYIMVIGTIIWLITKKIHRKYIFTLLIILLAMPFIAYQTLPTLQNRVKYFFYVFEYFKKANYLPGANDVGRIISVKAGWDIMNSEPVTGVGFGDILRETKAWYSENVPQMQESDMIYPSNEWLIYGAGCGWPGLLLFGVVMIIPFWIQTTNTLSWRLLNATAAFSFLFDMGLEVQYGVFIYSFVVLSWWKWQEVSD